MDDIVDAQIAKLNARRSHIAENINSLSEALANSISLFLSNVEDVYLEDLTDLADEYATKAERFCNTPRKHVDAL